MIYTVSGDRISIELTLMPELLEKLKIESVFFIQVIGIRGKLHTESGQSAKVW